MKDRATLILLAVALVVTPALAQKKNAGPLTIKEQGSFFVGGENKTITQPGFGPNAPPTSGEITVNQMYVQYQIPMKGDQHVPVVMVHGCCLSSKTWETTPDGRIGWSEYFVRKDRSVYLADQVSRARSGFDPTAFSDVRQGKTTPDKMPNILDATHQVGWTVFRFGPKFGEVFPDEQFPMQAADEFYKQMIPDLNSTLGPAPTATWKQMAALGVKLNGAVLMGHSESGFFPEQAALIDPKGIRGNISIEMPCVTNFSAGADRDAREDPDAHHVRRSPGRRDRRSRELGAVVRDLQHVRRPAQESRRRRRDDAPPRAWASKATATC